MSAAASLPEPTTPPSRSARLLGLVRQLIDYGRELATTIRQRAFTDPRSVSRCFGTNDLALILARITRGLHRADALEARLLRNAPRLDAGPRSAASPPRPRASRPAAGPCAAPVAEEADPRLALVPALDPGMPTPEQIAAEVRRRPIGVVIADICRDLGIMPSHPLWRELDILIIEYGGSLAALVQDVLNRVFPIPATAPAGSPAPPSRSPAPDCTGPP
jgi:hypothetical protein